MTYTENGTPTKKPIRFLCLHKAESHYEVVPKTERKYRFEQGHPYLVKFEEDIEYFRNHLSFVEQGKDVNTDKKTEEMNEKIADKVEEVMIEDAKDKEVETKLVDDINKEKPKIVEEEKSAEQIVKEAPTIESYSKSELKKMKKSEQIELIQKYKDNNQCDVNIPIRESGRVNLILELQGGN